MLKWTENEVNYLKLNYSNIETLELCEKLDRNINSITAKCNKLGLKKDPKYIQSKRVKTQFKIGTIPHNKGKKGWVAGGNSIKTRFKLGHKPMNYRSIGSERISKDGILLRKVADTGQKKKDWRGVHVLIWEKYNGKPPKNYIVIFKNKNRQDIRIENLEAISREENMRRNHICHLPVELVGIIKLMGILNRKINKIDKNYEK